MADKDGKREIDFYGAEMSLAPPDDISDDGKGSAMADVLQFFVSAAGSGVIGSVAYDLLKSRIEHFRSSTPRQDFTGDDLVARMAVRARCAEIGITAPRIAALHQVEASLAKSGERQYEFSAPNLRARVVLPPGAFTDDYTISVTLHASVPPPS